MAANEKLVERVREILRDVKHVKEKKMFSGITFMINNKMCISVGPDRLMLRTDPALDLGENPVCKPVIMKEKEMKGYVYVSEEVLRTKKELSYWVQLALAFNPKAKSSKKR